MYNKLLLATEHMGMTVWQVLAERQTVDI